MTRTQLPGYLGAAMICFSGHLAAQEVPAPGDPNVEAEALRRETLRDRDYYQQLESEREAEDQDVLEAEIPEAGDPLPESDATFVLRELRFGESALLSESVLDDVAAPYLGEEVSFSDLNAVVRDINQIYQERGLATARAFIRPQQIENGVVEITLVEGRLGELLLPEDTYTSERFLREQLALAQDATIDLPQLGRTLRYFNAGNELKMNASLRPGEGFGETDVQVDVQEPTRNSFQVFAANDGSASTGKEQLGVSAVRNNLVGRADQGSIFLVGAEGAVNGSLNYSVAVNRWGGRAGIGYSSNRIDIVQGGYEDLNITGNSRGWNLDYRQPLWVADGWVVDGSVRYSDNRSETEVEDMGVQLNDTKHQGLDLGMTVRRAGDGYQWQLYQNVEEVRAEALEEDRESLTVYRGGGSWLQGLGERAFFHGRAGWQLASHDSVPASSLFQIGGVANVRGYQQSVLSGSDGYYLSLGWYWQWRDEATPFFYIDHGAVYAESPDHEQITGAGMGLEWQWARHWRGQLIYGHGFNDVLPDQERNQVHARLVWSLD